MIKVNESAVVLFSGGQDSTTCLYWARQYFDLVFPIGFYYGQRHAIELSMGRSICDEILGLTLNVVDISFLQNEVDSALVGSGDINKGHKRLKNLPASFVPNRNQLFLTIAHAYAQKVGARHVIIGACETDFSGYPDCRDDFIKSLQAVTNLGSNSNIIFHTPLMWLNKAETFVLAKKLDALDVVIKYSHTCYEGDHVTFNVWGYGCGNCPACKLRKKGFNEFIKMG